MYAHIQDSMLHTRATDRTFRPFHPRALCFAYRLHFSPRSCSSRSLGAFCPSATLSFLPDDVYASSPEVFTYMDRSVARAPIFYLP